MRRYPGNFTDSDLLSVPRNLKVRPDHDTTHLAYITDKEADLLQKNKPGTPHKGPQGIPNYDGGDILTYTPSGMSGTGYVGPTQQQQQQQQQHDRQVQQNIGDTYKPPQEVYGKGAVPKGKRQTFTHETMGHKPFITNLIKGLSPEILSFWGVKPGAQTIPMELYQQLIQGSIVSGNEAVENKYRDKADQEWGIGTWDDIGAGEHPMFPGGLNQYYSDMAPSFYTDKTSGDYYGGGGWGGGYGYGGYGYGGGGGGGGGGGYYDSPSGMPRGQANEAWGPQNPLQQAMINIHGGQGFKQGFARGGIVSLVE